MQTRSSPSLTTLHRLARQISLEGYETMSKCKLFRMLQSHYNFDRVRRMEIRSCKKETDNTSTTSSSTSSVNTRKRKSTDSPEEIASSTPKTPKNQPINILDPIMMTPITNKKKAFKFTRPNGTMVQFNVDTLVDYLLCSGDFNDPETRIPFTDKDLEDIDALANSLGLNKQSVLAAKNNVNSYVDAKFRRDALLGVERCAGEVVAEMLEIVETFDPEDAQMQLVMNEFPVFMDYFRQLRDAEPEYAAKCISHWKLFIAGPPNRPNQDPYGLVNVVYRFLKSCEDGQR